jgi:hypothetical protein
LLVIVAVELDETESLAAVIVLANNVGGLDVQSLEDFGQTCVINAEGEVGHEQGVIGRGPGGLVSVVSRGTGRAGGAGSTGGSTSLASSRGGSFTTFWLGSSPWAASTASSEGATTSCTTSSSGSLTSGSIVGRGCVGVRWGLLLTGAGDFYVDLAAIDDLLVEEFNGLLGLLFGFHLNKAITKGTIAARNDAGSCNFSCSLELFGEVSVSGLEGQVANEYFRPPHDGRWM